MSLKSFPVCLLLSGLVACEVGCSETPAPHAGVTSSPSMSKRKTVDMEAAVDPPASSLAAATSANKPAPMRDPLVQQAANVEPATEASSEPAEMPSVVLTKRHESLSRVKVGDTMPEIELPKVGNGATKLSDLYGKGATVVVFWKSDRRMAKEELADLGPDIVEKFGKRGVAVVGVAVEESPAGAESALKTAAVSFPNLVDADGKQFAKVGAEKLPWTLVLDPTGKILWFDLEYSHATRRELPQALAATVK